MPAPSTKQIGPYVFTFGQLPAWENFRGFYAFARMLGPSAPAVFKVFTQAIASGKRTKEDLAPFAVSLIGTLPQTLLSTPFDEVEHLAKLVLKNVLISENGKTAAVLDVMDTKLQGDLGTMLELLAWCIAEAYGGFFVEAAMKLGTLLAVKKPDAPSPKAAPSASTSPST